MKYGYLLLLFNFLNHGLTAQIEVKIDLENIIRKDIPAGIGSANLCWLLDSDLKMPNNHKSFVEAMKEMKVGSLRFPYGHLADNYLWHTPPYYDTADGLRPMVATKSKTPGKWEWAVNQKGAFTSAMDFDEYMSLCYKLNIKPLVVVNILSFKYKGGPSFEYLVNSAVEWVKYAKKKNYDVAYWQIGNEIDHHRKLISKEEYVECYTKIVKAMKSVDPSIMTGPGIIGNINAQYFEAIINTVPELIDFTSVHQYMWKYVESCKNYELWKNDESNHIPKVVNMQKVVANSSKPTMDILVTETGVSPSGKGMGDINNTYKALWFFNVLMNQVVQPNVKYSYFWGTHSPWNGKEDNDNRDVEVLLRVDDNSRKPIADVIKLVNDNVKNQLVASESNNKLINVYASKDDKENTTFFLVNKDDKKNELKITIHGELKSNISYTSQVLQGKNPGSRKLQFSKEKLVITKEGNSISITIPPLSIVTLKSTSN